MDLVILIIWCLLMCLTCINLVFSFYWKLFCFVTLNKDLIILKQEVVSAKLVLFRFDAYIIFLSFGDGTAGFLSFQKHTTSAWYSVDFC